MGSPIVEATKRGIIELVDEILRKFPEAAYSFDKNNNNNNDKEENILRIAVEQKNWNMYNLLKKKVELMKDGMLVGDVDKHGNTILHLAAKLGTPSFTLVQRGHFYQMMWAVCWFKQVSYDSPPHLGYLQNSNGETAAEAFMKEHSETREKAEKAVKYMNNGLMLISTLIGTINYAALLTPPGGYRQDKEDPLYNYMVAPSSSRKRCALTSCSDFYLDLPLRLFFAMNSMFLSVVFTALSSLQVYRLDQLYFTRHVAYHRYLSLVAEIVLKAFCTATVANFALSLTGAGKTYSMEAMVTAFWIVMTRRKGYSQE
ncbi:hypothetical protein RHSIM_Rhsim05G0144500 [Rhododendron simsii]|uniref:PGG domain-containing protein n=1 Tax=Rhododendron simsii TaxID=118357 RepID=A0A834LKW6_RHOSS|nr:hypothetical protein RHSIM_Rhsim05G0144500 [Rhododendron simsii]